ncbi:MULTISPECIES: homoserine kinase [Desulfovibrio]|uniref:Shikimate kinase n=2 Tax=Desulfovibrio TaxID=872 RepID=A0AA94HQX8_DESDE|nr:MULTISPECIES: homoserine kinase [Desulfovibrio]ATD80383.1 shikimate kinase [Desulfovibrio sp. G11]SFW11594.1 shikimate kinase [Desulfovibrio desulfuricans]SPD35863.1 shikimate kinase [Desulfovibrio sp. G11]
MSAPSPADAPPAMSGPTRPSPCIILIGMAGAGKSTVGEALARTLGWAFMDSDHLIEAVYAARLQDVTDALGKSAFLDVESSVVSAIKANRTVIATGGSVVYREQTMRHLASLGPLVYLDVPFTVVEERIARNPQRGLAIAPGQTLRDIFQEREELYTRYATLRCPAADKNPQQCVNWIVQQLPAEVTMPDRP